jgi:VanZ family protein
VGDDQARPDAGAARTSARLALALLGYFVLVTLVITLSPFDFAPRRIHVSFMLVPRDLVANIALFLPIGFLVRSLDRRADGGWRSVSWAAAFSLCIELSQIFIRGRYVSPIDVATNTAGAYIGVYFRDRLDGWAVWDPRLVGRIGLDIPLVGLLYLLVPQLWLSSVGVVEDPWRMATTLLLGCAGSIVLVALHRHRWQGGVRLAARIVLPLALLWFTAGALPAFAAAPRAFLAAALAVVVLTFVLVRRQTASDEQRFEIETLRQVLPVFMLYMIVAALWPPFRGLAPWHGAIGFANRLNNAGIVDLLLLLEQVGGFTLFGYAVAEWRGRQELGLAADLPRAILFAAVFAALLELLQGMLAGPGASLVRALLSSSGAVYGVAVDHLARAHVRALRAGQERTAAAHDRQQAA